MLKEVIPAKIVALTLVDFIQIDLQLVQMPDVNSFASILVFILVKLPVLRVV